MSLEQSSGYKFDVEVAKVAVCLAGPDKDDGLPCDVHHGQGRTNLQNSAHAEQCTCKQVLRLDEKGACPSFFAALHLATLNTRLPALLGKDRTLSSTVSNFVRIIPSIDLGFLAIGW